MAGICLWDVTRLEGALSYRRCHSITFAVSKLVLSGQVWGPLCHTAGAGTKLKHTTQRLPVFRLGLSLLIMLLSFFFGMGNTHQGLILTSKQKYTCSAKQSVFCSEDLVILWLLACSVTSLSTFPALQWKPLYACASEPPYSLHSCISHLLHGHIPVSAGKIHGFIEGGGGAVSSSEHEQPREFFVYGFCHTSQGHALAPASKDIEAEVISIIWLRWVSFTKLCYENKMFLPSVTPRGDNFFVI